MDIVQQHMLDSYRATQHGEPVPPPPGRHEWEVFRDLRRRFRTWSGLSG